MAELTGPVIVTNYGEQQLLAGTFDVTKIKLGRGVWSPGPADTSLNLEEASVPASGTVEPDASGYRLRLAAVDDDDGNAYTLHEFALTDDTDQALAIYSQPTAIVVKTLGVDLLFSINWLIDNTVGPVTVSGATTYTLPLASQASAGLIEVATDAEVATATDTTRAITPKHGADIETRTLANDLIPKAVVRFNTGGSPTVFWNAGPDVFSITYVTAGDDRIRVSFDSSVVASPGQAACHVQLDSGLGFGPHHMEASVVATNQVEITVWNDSLIPIDMSGLSIRLTITVFGVAP